MKPATRKRVADAILEWLRKYFSVGTVTLQKKLKEK
jgi:hypothetical protein